MKPLIRMSAAVFLLLAALQLFGMVRPPTSHAAPSAFLYNPYYGETRGRNFWFDHKYPDYEPTPYVMVDYLGREDEVGYNGHDGYDYPLIYEPVLAAAAGTIGFAGWAVPDHERDLGLYIRVDHSNGHRTRYGHMSAIMYQTGEAVGARWQIGTSGTTGNSTGPHLHLTVLSNATGAWKVTDPYGWRGNSSDPWRIASGVISTHLWVADPRTPVPATYWGTVVDNLHSGFTKWCNTSSCPAWYGSTSGYNNHMWWTYSNGSTATYWARWRPSLPVAGVYEVFVHIPNYNATTHAARYFLQYGNGSRTVIVDQHDTEGSNGIGRWVSLGQHWFNAGTGGYVQVSDATYISGNYTEGYSNRVGVDAVQFVRRTP